MRIAVIGAGGVGGSFGAALHRAGQDVWFLARGQHLAVMRERGLRLTGARGDFGFMNVNATDRPREIGPVAVVLLAVKLWDVEEVLPAIAPLIGPNTVVITLQNGIDAPRQVAEAFGPGHVAAGSCLVNAGIVEPGWIVQHSLSHKISAGTINGERSAVLDWFATICVHCGIEFDLTDTPVEVVWEKFVHLVPVSAMTMLERRSIGAVRDDPKSWNLFLRIMDETVQVGRAMGATLRPEALDRRLGYVRNMPYDATASMAKDLQNGRRLELPWLSGRVVELGRHFGIPTPANEFVCLAIQAFAAREEQRAGRMLIYQRARLSRILPACTVGYRSRAMAGS